MKNDIDVVVNGMACRLISGAPDYVDLDAIEIDRERGGLAGLREMLKRLQRGELVLMFPEGTRTTDGRVDRTRER